MQGVDLELFRDIPGYKAILKAVLKSQIQVLVEQLAKQTGEESVLMTACIEEGTLSHLGSDAGKGFMDGHDNIKSQFLGFCIKRHQLNQQTRNPYMGLTRKRGPTTNKRQRNVTHSKRGASKFLLPHQQTATKSNSSREFMAIKNFDKTLIPNQPVKKNKNPKIINGSVVSLKENCGNVIVKKEPISAADYSAVRAEVDNQSNGLVTESQLNDSESVNQSKDMDNGNQSMELEAMDRSMELESGNQTNVLKDLNQSEGKTFGEMDSGTFAVITVEGDNVFTGNANNTVSQTVNGLDSKQDGQDMEQGTYNDASVFSHEKSINDQNKIVVKDEKPDFLRLAHRSSKRKVTPSAKRRLKEDYLYLENPDFMDADDRPYPCTTCPKRFKERHHLTYHLRTHSGHRPYVCEICNKAFTQTSSLNTHRKIHLNEINCGMCGQTFKRASAFSTHVCYTTEQIDNQTDSSKVYQNDNGHSSDQDLI